MVSPLVAAKMGTQVLGTATDLIVGGIQADMQRDAQKHRNTMSALSAAMSFNTVTLSEIDARDQAQALEKQIAIVSMQDKGNAEVNAAAAGVAGGSVDSVMRGLERSALNANYARMQSLENNLQSSGQDRKNITLGKIFNEDVAVIQSPSVGMALLGLGTGLVQTYNQNQPKGQQLQNRLSRVLLGKKGP